MLAGGLLSYVFFLLQDPSGSWLNLSWEIVWPIVQVVLGPFAPILAILAGVLVSGAVIGMLVKRFSS